MDHFHHLFQDGNGLNEDDWGNRNIVYGRNIIDVKLKPIFVLLFKEVISPFYIFQIYRHVYIRMTNLIQLFLVCWFGTMTTTHIMLR